VRPAGRGELESLYFRYPIFEARKVPELDGRRARHPVAIVGAGPVGMTAALALARYGVRCVLIEAKSTFNDGSRAICIARASFQILQQIGAVEPFVAKALGWRRGRSFYRGREILCFEMPHPEGEKYLPMYNIEQQYIEQYLWDAIARSGLIDTRWASEVTAIEQDADGVTLSIDSAPGSYSLSADYVLAADGARSAIRSMLGLRLKGENYEGRYVIADVKMDHDYPTERRAFFEPRSNPGGTVLIHKQPDDIWRVDYQLREGEDPEAAVEESNIRARVGAILEEIGHDKPWDLEWWSIYTANTLCLDEYRHGRVVFIGDSAHIVPIFGVRGLNNGMADAFNIAWKLGYVLAGKAHPRLIDTYSPERRGATLDVFANAGKSARFMTPPTRGQALVRRAVLSLAVEHPFAREFANPRQMQPYTYRETLAETVLRRDAEFQSGPTAGSASPNARLADGRYLLDLAGRGFSTLAFVDDFMDPRITELNAELARIDLDLSALIVSSSVVGGTIRDTDGAIARVFGAEPGSVYLLRPDLHIAGRWKRPVPGEIVVQLKSGLGWSEA
jgi:3-(3-hydroxy-phenyl)propionate hydroxylase